MVLFANVLAAVTLPHVGLHVPGNPSLETDTNYKDVCLVTVVILTCITPKNLYIYIYIIPSSAPNMKSRIAAPCRGSRELWQYTQSRLRVKTGKAAPI